MGMIVLHHGNPDLYQALEGQKNYPEEISPGKSTFDASHETRKPRASTESWGQLGSTPWVGPWRFLDFTLPEQLETLNFGDCYDQNLSRLIMPSGVKSLTLPFTRFFHMQLGELELPGGMARLPHVYHVLHAASRVFMDCIMLHG